MAPAWRTAQRLRVFKRDRATPQNVFDLGAIGIGATVVGRAPPTPPGVRVRTGRFEKLRSGEFGDSQAVEHGNGQYPVQPQTAVMPPPARSARNACRQLGAGTQLSQFAEDRGSSSPLLELDSSQSMPQPSVQPSHDRGGLRQPEVCLPARHVVKLPIEAAIMRAGEIRCSGCRRRVGYAISGGVLEVWETSK